MESGTRCYFRPCECVFHKVKVRLNMDYEDIEEMPNQRLLSSGDRVRFARWRSNFQPSHSGEQLFTS